MRVRRLAASMLTTALTVGAVSIAPGPIDAAESMTGVFIDGWPGMAKPYQPVNLEPADALVPRGTDVSQAYLESGVGSPPMSLLFESGSTAPLTVGSYSTATGANAQIGQLQCSAGEIVEYTVLEIERSIGGGLTRFAADFDASCPNWQPPLPEAAHGSIRYQSTIGFHAFSITPTRTFPWQADASVPDQAVGTSASTQVFVVTNTGSDALAVDVGDPVADDLSIGGGSCAGAEIEAGDTCTIEVDFVPTAPGPQTFSIDLLTPDLIRAERSLLIEALGTTETQISVDVDPLWHDEGSSGQAATLYNIDLDPPGAIGSVFLQSTCGVGGQSAVAGPSALITPPGPCDVWATFVGNTGSGYGNSASDVISFFQPARASVWARPTNGLWVTGVPVTIHVEADAGNADVPTDGTVSLVDVATGEVLASEPVTESDPSLDVEVVTFDAGARQFRAIFDGSLSMIGSTRVFPIVYEADLSPPTLWIHPDDYAGWTQETSIDLVLDADDMANEVTSMRLSDDGELWFEGPFASPVTWSLVDEAVGGSAIDGARTIRAQVSDVVGNWSDVATWDITLDRADPTGTLDIGAGIEATKTANVTMEAKGSDPGSGVAQIALSNDGITWTTRAYAPTQAWTLSAGSGSKTVFARWKDKAGNWSSVATDTITLDTVAPTVTAPRRGFVPATTIAAGRIQLRVPWTGTDATSGIARFWLQQQTDGGAWSTLSTTLTAPTLTRSLATGHRYAFRVKGIDRAGNVSDWATGPQVTLSARQETNATIAYSGTWSTTSDATAWGGALRRSSQAGAKASLTFTGRSVAWVARTGPDRGKAEVYLNGAKVATVDLYASSPGAQRVVWVGSWTTSISRKVTIKVLGTTTRPRVELDALVTAN